MNIAILSPPLAAATPAWAAPECRALERDLQRELNAQLAAWPAQVAGGVAVAVLPAGAAYEPQILMSLVLDRADLTALTGVELAACAQLPRTTDRLLHLRAWITADQCLHSAVIDPQLSAPNGQADAVHRVSAELHALSESLRHRYATTLRWLQLRPDDTRH